jgi:hypothetical protein
MKEILSQVNRSIDCPVQNCRIGVSIRCTPYELREALQNEQTQFECNAVYPSGCKNFSKEEVKIFYDKEGHAIDYELPFTDPKTILDFTLRARLVPYGEDVQGYFIGTSDSSVQNKEVGELQQNWNSLALSAYKANRSLFPPEQIVVEGKAYEISGFCFCDNSSCVSNKDKRDIESSSLLLK